jgi:hypothetical protein
MNLQVGGSYLEPFIILNDQSGPLMTVDDDNGCNTCTNNPTNSWNVGNAYFSMLGSSSFNWTASANSSYSFTDSNVAISGTSGTVNCVAKNSQGANIQVKSVPTIAVSNYKMNN